MHARPSRRSVISRLRRSFALRKMSTKCLFNPMLAMRRDRYKVSYLCASTLMERENSIEFSRRNIERRAPVRPNLLFIARTIREFTANYFYINADIILQFIIFPPRRRDVPSGSFSQCGKCAQCGKRLLSKMFTV